MYKDIITLAAARILESTGDITIIDASPESLGAIEQGGVVWKQNFKDLQARHRHISPDKLLPFISARYSIESVEDCGTSWRYLHGVENSMLSQNNRDDIEYVYILVNPGYKNLVKIGVTKTQVCSRVTSINATGTVDEWVAKFALPVKKGSAFKIEQQVHTFFASSRVSSDQGNSREFFSVDSLTAFDKVREVGVMFRVGNPIVY
jgi:hypothetical protein